MAKVKFHSVDKKERYRIIGNLFNVITNLHSKKEIIDFFTGLFTPSETLMAARRIQVAQLLLEDRSYEYICKKLGVSNQTIIKAEQWLHKGDDDHETWLKKQLIISKQVKKHNRGNDKLLDRYAHHRFLKDLLK